MTLLHVLSSLRYELGIRIHVGHVNHGLRKSAGQDRIFVERLADKLEIPVTSAEPIIKKSSGKSSIEELAREQRHRFLADLAKQNKAEVVALGHTQDDLAETVLMRILRGAGLQGIRGILFQRELNGVRFIRPLLEIKRTEVKNYLRKNHFKYRLDPTNRNTKFFRNRIRSQLLPYLEKNFNSNIKKVLANLAFIRSADYDYLTSLGYARLNKLKKRLSRNTVKFDLKKFSGIHKGMQRLLLRLAIEELQGNTNRLEFNHIRLIERLIQHKGKERRTIHLPLNLSCSKAENHLILSIRKT